MAYHFLFFFVVVVGRWWQPHQTIKCWMDSTSDIMMPTTTHKIAAWVGFFCCLETTVNYHRDTIRDFTTRVNMAWPKCTRPSFFCCVWLPLVLRHRHSKVSTVRCCRNVRSSSIQCVWFMCSIIMRLRRWLLFWCNNKYKPSFLCVGEARWTFERLVNQFVQKTRHVVQNEYSRRNIDDFH